MNRHKESFSVVLWMWNLVKKYRFRFYAGFIAGSTSVFYFCYLESYLVQEFTEVCVSGDSELLWQKLLVVGAMLLFGLIVYPVSFGMIYTTYSLISGEVKNKIFDKVLKTKLSYIESEYSGELVTRITADYNDAIQMVAYPVVGQGNPFALAFAVCLIVVVILWKNLLLGAVSIVLTAVSFLLVRSLLLPLQEKEKITKEITAKASQGIVDSLSGTVVSRMFGLKKMLVADYEKNTADIYNNNLSLIKRKSLLTVLVQMQGFLSLTAVCAIGLFLCTKEITDIPTVVFISLFQVALGTCIQELSEKISEMQKYIVGAKRLRGFFDAPEEEQRSAKAHPDMKAENAVELKDVCFRYPQSGEMLFDHFSLAVKRGERIGIAGGSGGGKSTLMKLLLEFHETDARQIYLFGNDMQDYSQRQVRDFFSYVPQDCYLFDGTIRENIILGNENVSEDKVKAAVESAYLTDFIESLPDGLDTRVGERGSLLSGGQRQRVAIARAFLKNAPVLLLDEATSALDSQSEEIVQKAIERLMADRTSIVIAHRLSTIAHMDRILVMEHGQIVEEGTHEQLLAKKKRYYQLYCM